QETTFKIFLNSFIQAILSHITFTNLKCGTADTGFCDFQKCYIKAVNRSHKYIDVHVNLKKIPVDNITVSLMILMRYNNGYKPFFVNITFDACKFLRNPNKNPIVKMFYYAYVNRSNINHTCPYDHDLIIDHFWTGNWEGDFGKYIPTLNGDYGVFINIFKNKIFRGFINFYVRISGRQN
ncbi:hypothetical protein KR054_007181, partial [Drosophila jambulina]